MTKEKPEVEEVVAKRLVDLDHSWNDLEVMTDDKGKKLFEANSQHLFTESCNDFDNWLTDLETQLGHEDPAQDLKSVMMAIKQQQVNSGLRG